MIVSQSADVVQNSFTGLWYTVAQYLPAILAAVIVFVIGWIVGVILYRIVVEVVKVLRIDDALKAAGLNDAAKEAGFTLDIGRFLGTLVMWFMVLVFLVASLDILGLNNVTIFLQQVVLLYLPQVIVAVLIIILGPFSLRWPKGWSAVPHALRGHMPRTSRAPWPSGRFGFSPSWRLSINCRSRVLSSRRSSPGSWSHSLSHSDSPSVWAVRKPLRAQ